jgi:Zn finger protein HypA/HybF involved in hydrogenase expression
MEVVSFNRTLEQELLALVRGVSLECLVCGEFLLRRGDALACPECGSVLRPAAGASGTQLEFDVQAG